MNQLKPKQSLWKAKDVKLCMQKKDRNSNGPEKKCMAKLLTFFTRIGYPA